METVVLAPQQLQPKHTLTGGLACQKSKIWWVVQPHPVSATSHFRTTSSPRPSNRSVHDHRDTIIGTLTPAGENPSSQTTMRASSGGRPHHSTCACCSSSSSIERSGTAAGGRTVMSHIVRKTTTANGDTSCITKHSLARSRGRSDSCRGRTFIHLTQRVSADDRTLMRCVLRVSSSARVVSHNQLHGKRQMMRVY